MDALTEPTHTVRETRRPAELLSEVRKHTETLLDTSSAMDDLLGALAGLQSVFAEVTGIDSNAPSPRSLSEGIGLPTGLALAPIDSARCLFDTHRTTKYLRAVYAAIRERRAERGEPVHVVYAGTGPYATLVVPLCAVLTPQDFRVTLIEVNPASAKALRALVSALGVADYTRNLLEADATTVQLARAADVVVAESLQKALTKEPQASIFSNLAPQLAEGGVMIPERTVIEAKMVDPPQEFGEEQVAPSWAALRSSEPRPRHHPLGTVYTLDAGEALRLAQTRERVVSAATLAVPDVELRGYQLMLFTRMVLFGDIVLEHNESGLTRPHALLDGVPYFDPGDTLAFHYHRDAAPRWTFEVV
jgi:hypothetical protein